MAQYDYRCKSCNTFTTIERSMNDPAGEVNCLSCGSKEMVRVYGSIGMLGVRSSANLDQEPFSSAPDFGGGGCTGGSCGMGGGCGLN